MNDPHVARLHYRIATPKNVDYKSAPAMVVETDKFCIDVKNSSAVVAMQAHCATKQEARELVEPYLHRWEMRADVQHGPGRFKFVFERAAVIDRSPRKSNSIVLVVDDAVHTHEAQSVDLQVSQPAFPLPPNDFEISITVRAMHAQYKEFREGRASLLSVAYRCLTELELSTGATSKRREAAATRYSIHPRVLARLGSLSTESGNMIEARKASKRGDYSPLTANERKWILDVIRQMILRAGEYAKTGAVTSGELIMDDLPAI